LIDYLIVGHVAKDVTPDGFRLGGTVSYAGLTALRLGARVGIVTATGPDVDVAARLSEADVRVVKSPETTTFENRYGPDGRRTQRLLARARPIGIADIPSDWRRAPIVHLAPLAGEFGPELLLHFADAGVVALTPQGWMRTWDRNGVVDPTDPPPLSPAARKRLDVVVVSDADFGYRWDVIERYARGYRLAIVTRGEHGARLYADSRAVDFPAYRSAVVDPTGAGDVFAAAFLLRLTETRDCHEAVDFANCAASLSIEGIGTSSLPDLAAILARRSRR